MHELSNINLVIYLVAIPVFAVTCVQYSQRVISSIDRSQRIPCGVKLFVCTAIGVTAVVTAVHPDIDKAVLILVTLLLATQSPIDLMTRRLARLPTSLVTIGITVLQGNEARLTSWSTSFWQPLLGTMAAVIPALILRNLGRAWLGWGDVLLMVPLSFAISTVSIGHLPWWLLIASVSGAVHGALVRVHGQTSIPFGPHLLFAAWFVFLLSA